MPIVNNKAIVDKAVSILSGLYKGVLKQHHLNGNVDFSGLSEQIMLAVQQGETDRIESIINKFVDGKIRNYDKVAGDLAIKADRAANHRRTVDDLIGSIPKQQGSIEDAIQKNAQILYERTGNLPEGYILNEEGKVVKDSTTQDIVGMEQEEKTTDGR